MTPNVLKAYKAKNYRIRMGNPEQLFSVLISEKQKRTISCSGGCTVSDAFVFMAIAKIFKPRGIFVIGNSFGLSTFILADLFPDSEVDVIDAELEGLDVGIGSALTKQLANDCFTNVGLTVGFSPIDLPKAMRREKYNLFFVDGGHTNQQMLMDFNGILPFCDADCIIYFHDVASANMIESWETVRKIAQTVGFVSFELGFTQMGCAVLVRGSADVLDYFANASDPFTGPYRIGFKVADLETKLNRPWFWDLTFGHLERVIKRKIRKVFGRKL